MAKNLPFVPFFVDRSARSPVLIPSRRFAFGLEAHFGGDSTLARRSAVFQVGFVGLWDLKVSDRRRDGVEDDAVEAVAAVAVEEVSGEAGGEEGRGGRHWG